MTRWNDRTRLQKLLHKTFENISQYIDKPNHKTRSFTPQVYRNKQSMIIEEKLASKGEHLF